MSVLIKGFIMPHCCDACSFSDWSNLHQTAVCKVNYYKPCFVDHSNEFLKRRSDSCPLVEIPEPHGDLIDRDAFRADFSMGENCDKCGIELKRCECDRIYTKMDFCGWLDDAPTIIEAEGSEGDADN